nr:hypothetical protein QSJ49_07135 [Halobacterium salinarum]
MDWTEVTRQTGREWERADGNAIVRARRTAGGDWAVTYERLTQAPRGLDVRTHHSPNRGRRPRGGRRVPRLTGTQRPLRAPTFPRTDN